MKFKALKIPDLLLISAIAVLIGRGLQGILHDFPIRALVWDESTFSGIATVLGYEWSAWVTNPQITYGIELTVKLLGLLFLIGGLLLCFPKIRRSSLSIFNLCLLSSLLLFLILFATKENFWRFGYFIEHALQLGAPLLLLAVLLGKTTISLLPVMRVLTALTFIGHGLFAVGYYPVPFHFMLMTMEGLGEIYLNFTGAVLTEKGAIFFLQFVGWLDFLAAAMLLFPWQKIGFSTRLNRILLSIALGWIIPWATLTTAARWWSNSGFTSLGNLLLYWGPEVLIRLPHILIPLLIWQLIRIPGLDKI